MQEPTPEEVKKVLSIKDCDLCEGARTITEPAHQEAGAIHDEIIRTCPQCSGRGYVDID